MHVPPLHHHLPESKEFHEHGVLLIDLKVVELSHELHCILAHDQLTMYPPPKLQFWRENDAISVPCNAPRANLVQTKKTSLLVC